MQSLFFSKKMFLRISSAVILNWALRITCLYSVASDCLNVLTFTTLWADSADNKLMIVYLFCLEYRL